MLAGDQKSALLDGFRRFQTADVDEARAIVGKHFCDHRLERFSGADRFDACQNRAEGRYLSLNYIRYGADVEIEPGELERFFLIQIPLTGTAVIRNGRTLVDSHSRVATILNPDRHTSMRWHTGCEQLLLQIDRDYLIDVAEKMTGIELNRGVRFSPRLDLEAPGLREWVRKLRAIVRATEAGAVFRRQDDLQQRHIEESLVIGLIEAQPNTISPLFERPVCDPAPAVLRRAFSLINDRFAEPLTLLDIADAAGATPRSLQLIFKKELGKTPIQYLQDLRLGFARHLLLSDAGSRSISETAYLSGHRHLGRFSAAYKLRYGESPKTTQERRGFV